MLDGRFRITKYRRFIKFLTENNSLRRVTSSNIIHARRIGRKFEFQQRGERLRRLLSLLSHRIENNKSVRFAIACRDDRD